MGKDADELKELAENLRATFNKLEEDLSKDTIQALVDKNAKAKVPLELIGLIDENSKMVGDLYGQRRTLYTAIGTHAAAIKRIAKAIKS